MKLTAAILALLPFAGLLRGEERPLVLLRGENQAAVERRPTDELAAFPVGTEPQALAFDGRNVWVANSGDNTVTKLRASDGASLGTFGAGNSPWALVFDGANIWVANAGGNTVTKLRASDGASLGTFPVGKTPWALAFDGAHVWVGHADETVWKLRVSDGAALAKVRGYGVTALAFDGSRILVADHIGVLCKLRPVDGAQAGDCSSTGGLIDFPAFAFDGANVWGGGSKGLFKVRESDGAVVQRFQSKAMTPATAIAFDGENIWVATWPRLVFKLRSSDGATLAVFEVGDHPTALTFDGVHIWVANSSSMTVSKLPARGSRLYQAEDSDRVPHGRPYFIQRGE